MKPLLHTHATSPQTTKLEEIVLRAGSESRLVFIPVLVDNPKDPQAGVDGEFLYQRGVGKDTWINDKSKKLSNLKSGEGYTLSLKAAELLALYEGLTDAYSLRRQQGTPQGDKTWIDARLADIGNLDYATVAQFLASNSSNDKSLLSKVIKWLASAKTVETARKLVELNPGDLPNLNALIGLGSLKETLKIWKNSQNEGNEEHWQQLLEERVYVLSQVLSFPLIVIKDKPYLGGKAITGKGGKYSDLMCANALTNSAVIVEIKTPVTRLLASKPYRGVYPFSDELSGAIAQVLNQRQNYCKHFISLASESTDAPMTAGACCVVIAGNVGKELKDKNLREHFELQRQSLHGVTVLTYDELFRKIGDLVSLFEYVEE
ncbi:MAG TPA: Shedu immune nuclease family protein [Candidatus Angelobacter sp.]|nr:Shedu immune nuclease family protein [Candidatus Angelobacter sp.]